MDKYEKQPIANNKEGVNDPDVEAEAAAELVRAPQSHEVVRKQTSNSWADNMIEHNGELTRGCKIMYFVTCAAIIIGVASVQGYLTSENENDLIDLQAEATCENAFELIGQAWSEARLFAETMAAAYTSIGYEMTMEDFYTLPNSKAFKSLGTMRFFNFVKHINGDAERYEFQNKTILELPSFFIHGGDLPNEYPYGQDRYDPIVYVIDPENTFGVGFFPPPEVEPERVVAIDYAIETGEISASGPIPLFGAKIQDKPPVINVYVPLFTQSGNATQVFEQKDDVYGFINPVYKIDQLLDSILFGTGLDDISVHLYDITADDYKGYLGSWYTGNGDFDFAVVSEQTAEENTADCAQVDSTVIEVGGRRWQIHCCVEDDFITSKRSLLPYFIFMLSVMVSMVYNGVRIILKHLLLKADVKIQRERSRRMSRVRPAPINN